MTTHHTANFTTNDEDNNDIIVTVHYSITPSSYDPHSYGERYPAEWEVNKIWFGDTRLNCLADVIPYDDMLAREIESYLDNEIEEL